MNNKKNLISSNLKKRLFIAIDLPDSLKKYLYDMTKKLFINDKDIRVIPPDNIHITLKFLGDTPVSKIKSIIGAIKETTENFNKFTYKISNCFDGFPKLNQARILFVPIKEGDVKFKELFLSLEENLSKIKISRENKKFVSHITVARIRDKKNLESIVSNTKFNYEDKIICSKLTFFESILKPSGAEYIIIDEFELK